MQAAELVLRDVHVPVAPSLWPPAPGWWLVAVVTLLALGLLFWWRSRRKRRRAAIAQLFDDAVAAAGTAPAKIAAMSELLRRASRRKDPGADRMQGDDWLLFLDKGLETPVFSAGAGRVLSDGGYRRDIGKVELESLHAVARGRFILWMTAR